MKRPCVSRSMPNTPVVITSRPDPSCRSTVAVTFGLAEGPEMKRPRNAVTNVLRLASMPSSASCENRSGVFEKSTALSAKERGPNRRTRRNPRFPPLSRDADDEVMTGSIAVNLEPGASVAFTELISAVPSPKNHEDMRRLGWLKGSVDNGVATGSVPADPPSGIVADAKPPWNSISHLPDEAPCACAADAVKVNSVAKVNAAAAHRYDIVMMTSAPQCVERPPIGSHRYFWMSGFLGSFREGSRPCRPFASVITLLSTRRASGGWNPSLPSSDT